MSGQEMQRTSGSRVKTSGWHAGHRCPARSNPGGFSTIQRARRGGRRSGWLHGGWFQASGFRRNGRLNSQFSSAMGGARPIPPARETGRPARRWLGPWFPGAPRAPGWLRETSSDGGGGRAGCARRFFRHALPEGVVGRGFCETECASSRPYCRPDTTFALVWTLSKSGLPFFEWVLPTLVINHLGHIREFFLLAVNHSSNHPRGGALSNVRTREIKLTARNSEIGENGHFIGLRHSLEGRAGSPFRRLRAFDLGS